MASYVNLDGYQDTKYFARSWALLTREPGWFSRVALLWLANLVPIIGPIGASGYIAEWSRLTAWNVNTSPSRAGGTVGGYIRSGWHAFLVGLGWGLAWGLLAGIIGAVPVLGAALSTLISIVGTLIGVVTIVAVLRATIYQQVGPGFNVSTIFQMVEKDFVGLLRILGLSLAGGLIIAGISTIVLIIAVIPSIAEISAAAQAFTRAMSDYGSTDTLTLSLMVEFFLSLVPSIIATCVIVSFFAIVLQILVYNAVGLWIRQYNVPAWGGPDDPLPAQFASDPQYYAPQQYPQQPYDPNMAYQNPNQVPYAYGNTDYGQATTGSVGQAYNPPNQQYGGGQGSWPQQ